MDQSLRSKENVGHKDIFDLFPGATTFREDKLPTLKEAIGVARGYQESHNCTFQDAAVVVAHKLYDHWVSRNIYPITWQGIKKKLDKKLQQIRKLSRTSRNKRGKSWVQAYKQVEEKSNKLFDIFCQIELSRKSLEEQYGITMLNENYGFLESRRTDRKASCEGKVDTKYHIAEAGKRKQSEKYEKLQKSVFLSVSSKSTEHMQLSKPENSQESEQLQSSTAESEIEKDDIRQKYKRVEYVHQASVCKPHTITRSQARNLHDIDKPSILPEQFHMRKSEKRVRDEVYWAMAKLSGHGFSYREIRIAMQVVGNTLFGTKWKLPRELDKDLYDIDSNEMEDESEFHAVTLPIRKNKW